MPPKGAAPKAPPLVRPAEVKAPPAKKARADDVGPVPAVRPRAPAAGQPPVPVNPELPQPESTDVDVVMVMRGVIEYVKVTLRERLRQDATLSSGFADVPLDEHAPLEIRGGSGESDLLSYKAPWVNDKAMVSLGSTGLYEGGGNLFWANPFPDDRQAQVCAGEVPGWPIVWGMAECFRCGGQTEGTAARDRRILFPVTLCLHASTLDGFKGDSFAGSLRVVTGHAAIYGWYVAMCEALGGQDRTWVATLWQAALTVTLQAHIVDSPEALAVLSMKHTSDMASSARNLEDTFPAFARKLQIALRSVQGVQKRLEHCAKQNIRFNGSLVSRVLLSGACTYVDRIDDRAHALLLRLENKFGKEVLTTKYNNLVRIIQICHKELESVPKLWDGSTCSDLASQIFHFIMWAFQHEVITPNGLTVEFLDKTRDGVPGCCHKVLAKVQLVAHLRGLSNDLPKESKARTSFLAILDCFISYGTYNASFGQKPDGHASTLAGEAGDVEADEQTDPFEEMRTKSCKTGQCMLDFLFDLFDGTNDKDLLALLQKNPSVSIGLLDWKNLEGDAGKKLRELTLQVSMHRQAVSVSEGAPPPPSTRELRRALSGDGSGDQHEREEQARRERTDAWKSAQTSRKRHATVSVAKFKTKADLQKWFLKQRLAHEFVGKPGECHRVFVASADTFGGEGLEPWQYFTDKEKDFKEVLEFMTNQTSPWDVLLSFDGRNMADRKLMEPIMEPCRNVCEVWIVYEPTKRLGRRVAWGSDNKEICWMSFPVPRTSLTTKDRGGQAAAKWAETTHSSFYAGVPPAPWQSLPLISAADKASVLGKPPTEPATKIFDADRGMPLYWQERKPVDLWADLLSSLDAKLVVDLSPGSGSAGRAAMRLGINYVAACREEAHASWVSHILDREACELIVKAKSPLFEQDLANLIKTHFAEVLSQMDERAKATDASDDDEAAE